MSGFGSAAQVPAVLEGIDEELQNAVDLVLERADKLTPQQLKSIDLVLSPLFESKASKPLTLFEQMIRQRRILERMTNKLFDDSGDAKAKVGTKDVKDGISAMSQLTKLLSDLESQVYTAERARRIESVIIQTVKMLPRADQDNFFQLLEANFIHSYTLEYSEELANDRNQS